MHPLFVRIDTVADEYVVVVTREIPHIYDFSMKRLINTSSRPIDKQVLADVVSRWAQRKGIKIGQTNIGIVDVDAKSLYYIDILAQRRRPLDPDVLPNQNENVMLPRPFPANVVGEITFILVYITDKVIRDREKNLLRQYCREMQASTQRVYKFSPCVYILNIYEETRLYSMCIEP